MILLKYYNHNYTYILCMCFFLLKLVVDFIFFIYIYINEIIKFLVTISSPVFFLSLISY